MTFDTVKHIEAMQETALALEAEARANGRYSKDCAQVNDAITRGQKSGVALLWGADGKMEVIDLNGGAEHVTVSNEGEHVTIQHNLEGWHNPGPSEQPKDNTRKIVEEAGKSYEQIHAENFKAATARSHGHANAMGNRFPPVMHEGPARSLAKGPTRPTGDAARRAAMTADARKFAQDQFARNERIAAAMKARSALIHK